MATYLFLPGCYRPTIETQRWWEGVYELPRGRKYESERGTRGGSLAPSLPDSIGFSSCADWDTPGTNDYLE